MRTYFKRRSSGRTLQRQIFCSCTSRPRSLIRFLLKQGDAPANQVRRSEVKPAIGLAVAILLVCWSATPAAAFSSLPLFPHRNPLHKKIEALEMEWREALLTNNIPEISNLLADDYLGISADGTLETKADVLAKRRSGHFKITELNLSDIKIRIYGATAVVTSKAEVAGTAGSKPIGGFFRYTRVYTKRGDQWKIVSFEASRIHPHIHD